MRVQMPGSRNSGSGAAVESGPVAAHKAQQSKAPVSMERAKSARRPMSQRATIWQRDSTSACIATKSVNLHFLSDSLTTADSKLATGNAGNPLLGPGLSLIQWPFLIDQTTKGLHRTFRRSSDRRGAD